MTRGTLSTGKSSSLWNAITLTICQNSLSEYGLKSYVVNHESSVLLTRDGLEVVPMSVNGRSCMLISRSFTPSPSVRSIRKSSIAGTRNSHIRSGSDSMSFIRKLIVPPRLLDRV